MESIQNITDILRAGRNIQSREEQGGGHITEKHEKDKEFIFPTFLISLQQLGLTEKL